MSLPKVEIFYNTNIKEITIFNDSKCIIKAETLNNNNIDEKIFETDFIIAADGPFSKWVIIIFIIILLF